MHGDHAIVPVYVEIWGGKMAETGNKTPLDNDAVDDVNIHARGPVARLRGYLFAGIVVTAPISITIYLTYVFLTFVDSKVAGLLPRDWYDALYGATTFPGIGVVISLVGFVLIGWFATNFFGRLIIRISEYTGRGKNHEKLIRFTNFFIEDIQY